MYSHYQHKFDGDISCVKSIIAGFYAYLLFLANPSYYLKNKRKLFYYSRQILVFIPKLMN